MSLNVFQLNMNLIFVFIFSLEMQKDANEWQKVITIADSLAYTIKDLCQGSKYKFRVRAENIHGRGESSDPSDEITIADPNLPVIQQEEEEVLNNKQHHIVPGGDFKLRFDILEELGKGRFGVVHKVIEKDTGVTLAAKIIKCIKAKDRLKVQDEISIMEALQHPKLLQLSASFENSKEIIMVME